MCEVRLDLDFSADLFFNFALRNFVLVEDLQGADEAGGLLFGEVDTTKLSLSEGLANIEHRERPLLGGR